MSEEVEIKAESDAYVAGSSVSGASTPTKDNKAMRRQTPIMLYVVIGVLSIAVVVLAVLLGIGVGGGGSDEVEVKIPATGGGIPSNTSTTNQTSGCAEEEEELSDYLEFALNSIESLRSTVCELEIQDSTFAGSCDAIDQLRAEGENRGYEETLPYYYYVNFLGLTVAYTIVLFSTTDPMKDIFTTIVRHHRALAYGNALRLQGWPEDVVQTAYWKYEKMLEAEDAVVPAVGDGVQDYCDYINVEYEQLKQYGRENFAEEQLPSVSTFGATSLFGTSCLSQYIVRTDWESHRREAVSSLMSKSCSRPIVLYTIWHWESLLALFTEPAETLSQMLFTSIEVIVETFSNPEAFPC